jgi:hypothetical protein
MGTIVFEFIMNEMRVLFIMVLDKKEVATFTGYLLLLTDDLNKLPDLSKFVLPF